MSDRPYSFQGIQSIYLQPYDEDVPYEFYFKITSAAGANDGSIPFGRTLKGGNDGCNVSIRSHPEDVDYTTEIVGAVTNTEDIVTVLLSYPYVTQMRVAAIALATTMEVDSTTGMLAGDKVGIELDDDTIHWTTIASVTDGDTFELTDGIPAGGAAAIDNDIYIPRIVRGMYHLNFDCVLDDDKNKEFDFNRVIVGDR